LITRELICTTPYCTSRRAPAFHPNTISKCVA